MTAVAGLSRDAAALYDRQIRVWGVSSQLRLGAASVLILGSSPALASEIAKNLVLAGVKAVMLADDGVVQDADLTAGYCLGEEDVGSAWVECVARYLSRLNPRVEVASRVMNVAGMGSAEMQEMVGGYSAIMVARGSATMMATVSAAARSRQVPVVVADCPGKLAFMAYDLGSEYIFSTENKQMVNKDASTTTTIRHKKRRCYQPVADILFNHQWQLTGHEAQLLQSTAENMPARRVAMALKRLRKRIPTVLLAMRVLFQFEARYGRRPSPTKSEDMSVNETAWQADEMQRLRDIRVAVMQQALMPSGNENTLPLSLLPDQVLNTLMHGAECEFLPTISICAGYISQDLIRIMTAHGPPAAGDVVTMDVWRGEVDVSALRMAEEVLETSTTKELATGERETMPGSMNAVITVDVDTAVMEVDAPSAGAVIIID